MSVLSYEYLCEWVQAVTPDMLPDPPINWAAGVTVVDPAKWLDCLQCNARDPKRGRGKFALESDLRKLHAVVIDNAEF